jgi:tRNA A-37 threonylcarbamoyl transferase component Bud32
MRTNDKKLIYGKDFVEKQQESSCALAEYSRTEMGRRVSLESGEFIVPEVLSFDEKEGSIVFERLYGFENLLMALSVESDHENIMNRVGQVLACIHDHTMIHGDFSWQNVLYNKPKDTFAIIDWSSAHWLNEFEKAEDIYIDVGIMLMSLFSQHYFSSMRPKKPRYISCLFLKSYMVASSHKLEKVPLEESLSAMLRLYWISRKKQIGLLRTLLYLPTKTELKEFVLSFDGFDNK